MSSQLIIEVPQQSTGILLADASLKNTFEETRRRFFKRLPEPILSKDLSDSSDSSENITISHQPDKHFAQKKSNDRPSSSSESFHNSIEEFVKSAESSPPSIYSISKICDEFSFQRRRLYDVINVFESVGCCKKTSVDSFMWFGLQNVIPTLLLLQDMYKINSPSESLDQLFPDHKCISISNLSINLVLLFFALQANTLDIKKIGQFLSRHNKRLKTTLCKLYQITFILDAAGILSKGDNIGEIVLNPRFFALRMPMKEEPKIDILSIESLLNRPRNAPVNYIQCRNQDFEMFAKLIGESLIEI